MLNVELSKTTYQKQLEAMIRLVYLKQKQVEGGGWEGLETLLEEFYAFAKEYIILLQQCPDEIFIRRFALATGIQRLQQEWNTLIRACEQRLGPYPAPPQDSPQEDPDDFRANLRRAEAYLSNYCRRWLPGTNPYLRIQTPVVYFEKLFGISRAIYKPEIPIISIPLSDYNDTTRWQALAHELGHHIYWNALPLEDSEQLHTRLHEAAGKRVEGKARIRLWSNWIEEVFADVLGTLLAGPSYAISAQDLAADCVDELQALAHHDHQHPCTYLRPLVSIQVLREMAARSESPDFRAAMTGDGSGDTGLVARIEERWAAFCGSAPELKLAGGNLKLKSLTQNVQPIVEAILNEAVWPGEKTLWELVNFYGQHLNDSEVERQGWLGLSPDDLEPVPETLPDPLKIALPSAPQMPDIPDHFKIIWKHTRNSVEQAHGKANLPQPDLPKLLALAFWGMLLRLDLSDFRLFHTHRDEKPLWHPHGENLLGTITHYHRHAEFTGAIILR